MLVGGGVGWGVGLSVGAGDGVGVGRVTAATLLGAEGGDRPSALLA